MARFLAGALVLLLTGCTLLARAEPVNPSRVRSTGAREHEGWRPVRESPKSPLRQPVSAYYVDFGTHKKLYRVEPSTSNKVEVFAPAPPSILGSFSGFGHDTVKSRQPVKAKKPFKESFQQAESRYPPDLLSPPGRPYPQSFKTPDSLGQAYYFEASLSPPPRDSAINFVPPPSSKGIAPNSYYLQFDQQTRTKPTAAASFSPYLRQGLPIYGAPAPYYKPTSASTDPYKFYSPQPPSKLQQYDSRPSNSHGRPPGIDYFGSNPFGDIHLNTNRPETKTPAKDVFEQLSPLGRPFQSSTVEPPRLYSQVIDVSFDPIDYFSTSGNFIRQTTPKPFRASPLIVESFPSTERPSMYVTPGPSPPSRDVYPISVTTLDIPSRDDFLNKPPVPTNTYQINPFHSIPESQQYHEEVTNKPITTTYFRKPEVNTNRDNYYQSTPFLPTPATDSDQNAGEPAPTELNTPSSESNEVQTPTRTRTNRPRYRKKKPTRKPDYHQFVDTTTDNNFETPVNEYSLANEEQPKITTLDSLQNTYQTEREPEQQRESERYDEKYKRRRPSRPNNYQLTSTLSNTESEVQEDPTALSTLPDEDVKTQQRESERYDEKYKRRRPSRPNNYQLTSTLSNTESEVQEVPTALSTLPEEDVKTFPPSTSTTALNKVHQRRRKKPLNRQRGTTRNGLLRSSSTSTTTEPPQDLTSEIFTHTDYQSPKETNPTENYPFNGLSFNEYGHVMLSGTDDYNANTLLPTQQIDEYQTNYHEIVTTSTTTTTTTTTTEPTKTTTTSTTTVAPETTPSSSTHRARIRNKYNYSNNRPRFSVKDYRERLNKATSTTTEVPKEAEDEEQKPPQIRPVRVRGSVKHTDNQEEQVETSTRRFKPRYTSNQRHAYRTSTTPSPLLQLDSPTTTERANSFRPSSLRRPGGNKYYSRYRTSTETPEASELEPVPEKLPQRPKGVFSAKKRRPFPLRSRPEATDETQVENHSDANDLEHDAITKKSDHVATTTLMTSSEEADWNTPSSVKPEIHTLDSIDHGEITKKIADLTSSPSNSFDSSGFFKGVSPSSRRTVSQITLATEDPILPIEAFFSSSLKGNNSR